jgi:hypothetical protein
MYLSYICPIYLPCISRVSCGPGGSRGPGPRQRVTLTRASILALEVSRSGISGVACGRASAASPAAGHQRRRLRQGISCVACGRASAASPAAGHQWRRLRQGISGVACGRASAASPAAGHQRRRLRQGISGVACGRASAASPAAGHQRRRDGGCGDVMTAVIMSFSGVIGIMN